MYQYTIDGKIEVFHYYPGDSTPTDRANLICVVENEEDLGRLSAPVASLAG